MVYKYLKVDADSPLPIAPVTERTLKFAQVQDLNDPFENLTKSPVQEDVFNGVVNRLEDHMNEHPLYKALSEDEKKYIIERAVLSQKGQYDGTEHSIAEFHNQRRSAYKTAENLGILSLTPNIKSSLMWSHYADMHRGYVLGFDEKHPWFNPPAKAGKYLGRLLPVEYVGQRINQTKGIHNQDDAFIPFFRKSLDWAYEEELRVIFPFQHQFIKKIHDNLYVREYPLDMLREVIFGIDMKQEDVETIKTSLKDASHIKYFRAMPSSISYGMELIPEEEYFDADFDIVGFHKKRAENFGIDTSKLK